MAHNKELLHSEIRRYRAKFWGHDQIIAALKIPEQTYYRHWKIIKEENARVYDKLTEENIREDMERVIKGMEQKIQELQYIIDHTENEDSKIKAIETQAQLMASIPKQRQQGAGIIEIIGSGYTNTGESKAHSQAQTAR